MHDSFKSSPYINVSERETPKKCVSVLCKIAASRKKNCSHLEITNVSLHIFSKSWQQFLTPNEGLCRRKLWIWPIISFLAGLCLTVFSGSVCLLYSVLTGHQHAESVQELHYSGPAGGVQKLHPEPCHGDVPSLWQTTTSQHPHTIQVSVCFCSKIH